MPASIESSAARADVTRHRRWRLAIQFVVFQGAWLACVISAARGDPWPGIATVAAAVALHLGWSVRRGVDAVLIAVSLIVGLAWDSALIATGWLTYASPGPLPALAPAWILSLWALFATILRDPLRWLHGRPWLAVLFGAVGGPLSYASAARLGACQFVQPLAATLALGVGWAVVTPLLVELARRLTRARQGD